MGRQRIFKKGLLWVFGGVIILLAGSTAFSQDLKPRIPSKADKCPVCGMFVCKYPDWTAQAITGDGSVDFFDGAKDLFKYVFNLQKYRPGKNSKNIAAVYVTEYYDMKTIDAREAFFVTGSDVLGPMGRELIPFSSREDAETFKKDHNGTLILEFGQITPAVIEKLDP